ncbi:MAG: PilZ domain-containing protein [bacterium]
MRLWFQRMTSYFRADDPDVESVRSILRTAALRSASIGVGTLDGVALPSPLSGHVEELEEGALVISRPHDGPARRELVAGEMLHLSIAADNGFHHGDVEVLGRWTSGEGSMKRYGYRVSIPRALVHEERRSLHRVPVAFDLAPRALLSRPVSLNPLGEGTVIDVSEGGLCVRVEMVGLVRPDEHVVVRAEFPAYFPTIMTEAVVAHVMASRSPRLTDLGLRFVEPPAELGRAIRQLELRRVNRAGAA